MITFERVALTAGLVLVVGAALGIGIYVQAGPVYYLVLAVLAGIVLTVYGTSTIMDEARVQRDRKVVGPVRPVQVPDDDPGL